MRRATCSPSVTPSNVKRQGTMRQADWCESDSMDDRLPRRRLPSMKIARRIRACDRHLIRGWYIRELRK
jgi:hypothetical protein